MSNALRYNWFDPPAERTNGEITVIPHTETMRFGAFEGYSVQPRITKVRRGKRPDAPAALVGANPLVHGETTDSIVVTWKYDTRTASDEYSAAVDAAVTLSTKHGRPAFAAVNVTPTSTGADARTAAQTDDTSVTHERVTTYLLTETGDFVDYGDISVTIGNSVIDSTSTGGTAATATSDPVTLAGVASSVTDLAAKVTIPSSDANLHNLTATWYSPASPQLDHRVLVAIPVNGVTRWYRLPITELSDATGVGLSAAPSGATAGTVWRNTARGSSSYKKWSMTAFNLNQALAATDAGALVDDVTGVATGFTATQLRGATDLRIDTSVVGGGDDTWMTRATNPISR